MPDRARRCRRKGVWTLAALSIGLAVTLLGVAGVAGMQEVSPQFWRAAAEDYTLVFPRDHASHPDYRIEWWYYTGNLEASDGRRFGYQVTFFRVGIDREPVNPSRWAVRDLYMAHLAVTDVSAGRHLVAERLNRAGVGWAGARTDRLEVWNEGWKLEQDGRSHVLTAMSDRDAFGVDIRLAADGAPVMHGTNGFSQKGSQVGNASHYYSFTRMRTSGRLTIDRETIEVEGLSWMDHEFGTTFLESTQQGWDWFSLQLDDGTDLMVYLLRQQDGSRDAHSSGTLVDAQGGIVALGADDYRLVPGRIWSSPTSGARYPVEWRIEIPSVALELEVRAAVDAQELHTEQSTGVTYWEGAVDAVGTRAGHPVAGRGFLELTGYAGVPISEVLR